MARQEMTDTQRLETLAMAARIRQNPLEPEESPSGCSGMEQIPAKSRGVREDAGNVRIDSCGVR